GVCSRAAWGLTGRDRTAGARSRALGSWMSAIPRGYLRVRARSCRMWGPGRRGAAEADAVGGREVVTTARTGQRQLADEPHGGPGRRGTSTPDRPHVAGPAEEAHRRGTRTAPGGDGRSDMGIGDKAKDALGGEKGEQASDAGLDRASEIGRAHV